MRRRRVCNDQSRAQCAAGFTLIEILMVVVIMLIASGLALPSFVRSYRSAKLRTSARTIVMAGRYARSVAVLQHIQTSLLLDRRAQEVEVVAMEDKTSAADKDMFLESRSQQWDADEAEEKKSYQVNSRLTRSLADSVRIASVTSEGEIHEHEGIYWVNYYPNGMCDEYSVRLVDDRDQAIIVRIDPISGKAKVEYEQ